MYLLLLFFSSKFERFVCLFQDKIINIGLFISLVSAATLWYVLQFHSDRYIYFHIFFPFLFVLVQRLENSHLKYLCVNLQTTDWQILLLSSCRETLQSNCMRPAQELPIFSHLRDPDSFGKHQEIWPTPSSTPWVSSSWEFTIALQTLGSPVQLHSWFQDRTYIKDCSLWRHQ